MVKLTPEEGVKSGGKHEQWENVKGKENYLKLQESCSYVSVVALVTKR